MKAAQAREMSVADLRERIEIEKNKNLIAEGKLKLGSLNLDVHNIQTNIASIKEHISMLSETDVFI